MSYMKKERYTQFLCLVVLILLSIFFIAGCQKCDGTTDAYYIYEDVWTQVIQLDNVQASSHYNEWMYVLGEQDDVPVLLCISTLEAGERNCITLPDESFKDVSACANGVYLISAKSKNVTLWLRQDDELISMDQLELQGAHSIAVDGQGTIYLAGKTQLCIYNEDEVSYLDTGDTQWLSLLRDDNGHVYAGFYGGYYAIDASTKSLQKCDYDLGYDTGQFDGGDTTAMTYSLLSRAGGKDGIQLEYGGLISEFDAETGESTPIFDTAGWVETGRLFHVIRASESTCLCYIIDEDSSQLTVKKIQKTEQKKQIITVARQENNAFVGSAIADFNRNSREYYAEVRSYLGENAQTRLNLDIVSGKAPDIISLHLVPYEAYAQNGILMDLQPLIDKTYSDGELHTPALDALRASDGKLYRIAPVYNLRALAIADDLRPGDSWTFDDMYTILAQHPDMTFFKNATGDAMIRTFLPTCMELFVDEANATCSFDGPQFQTLLTKIKEICARNQKQESAHPYQDHEYLIYPLDVYDFRDYQTQVPDGLSPIGFPTYGNTGVTMYSVVQFGICSATEKVDAAWAFLQTVLSEEVQDNVEWFPLRVSSLEKMAEKAATKLPGELKSEYEDPAAAAAGTNTNMITHEIGATDPMTQAQIDNVWWLLNSIDSFAASATSDEIVGIVREEAAAFLLGDRSVEEVTEIIQNRVSIYLAETRK